MTKAGAWRVATIDLASGAVTDSPAPKRLPAGYTFTLRKKRRARRQQEDAK